MKSFITDDFVLHGDTARELYHDYAANQPIFDYHCHLRPKEMAEDRQFDNIAQMWLEGDHYKWRAMRTNGVEERYVTGDAPDREKFRAWARTVPATIGNPLYHWTHLELRRPFGITDLLLDEDTADTVWERTAEMLRKPEFSTRGILKQMNVKFVCTTDDPADDLRYHKQMAADSSLPLKVLPAFRPDKVLAIEAPDRFNNYVDTLGEAADLPVTNYQDLLDALERRLTYFHRHGARISDHALQVPVAADYTGAEIERIFEKARAGTTPSEAEVDKFRTAIMEFLGRLYHAHGWVMQLHIGAQRNNNSRMFKALGPDTGFDSMADGLLAQPLARFLDRLDSTNELPKTIIYNLNPRDNEMLASLIGCYQDGSIPGKMQLGPAWWFNDQKDGMEWHLSAVANMGLLRRFVGMLTDSRSFLSFARHEYFRRILCNTIGSWVDGGQAPRDMKLLGSMVEDICYRNAINYFGTEV